MLFVHFVVVTTRKKMLREYFILYLKDEFCDMNYTLSLNSSIMCLGLGYMGEFMLGEV